MQICVDVPKWIWAYTDEDMIIYELSRMIRETISILTERPRTSPEKVVKRAIARLLIARMTVEALIAVRRDVKREIVADILRELDEATKRVMEKVGEL